MMRVFRRKAETCRKLSYTQSEAAGEESHLMQALSWKNWHFLMLQAITSNDKHVQHRQVENAVVLSHLLSATFLYVFLRN